MKVSRWLSLLRDITMEAGTGAGEPDPGGAGEPYMGHLLRTRIEATALFSILLVKKIVANVRDKIFPFSASSLPSELTIE